MPCTRGCSRSATSTRYGAMGGWERNMDPRVSMNSGAQSGVPNWPSDIMRITELVPCRAYQRPPRVTQSRRTSCAVTDGITLQV